MFIVAIFIYIILLTTNVSSQDCRSTRAGYDYNGNIAVTANSCTCKAWTDPVNTRYTDSTFVDGSKAAASNKCRNPGNEADRPWCYIVNSAGACDSPRTFDYCDNIPVCSKACRETEQGKEYNGLVTTGGNGQACTTWSSYYTGYDTAFQADPSVALAGANCRNVPPDIANNPSAFHLQPWCVTATGVSLCNINFCSDVPGACRTDQLGILYTGNVSKTVTNRNCDSWSTRWTGAWPIAGETAASASNYCRNPNNSTVGLWCYVVGTSQWEPCLVPVCIPKTSCPQVATDYFLYRDSVTFAGCNSWSTIYTSKASTWYNLNAATPTTTSTPLFHPALLSDTTLADAKTYCRNPDNDANGPWCPAAGGTSKIYCTNPCYAYPCLTEAKGLYYSGTISKTRLGVTCQAWITQTPSAHPYATTGWFPDGSAQRANNFCRNPDQNNFGPWCYKTTNISSASDNWDYCTIPWCQNVTTATPTINTVVSNCKSATGLGYTGTFSAATNGMTCQTWSAQTPVTHQYYLPQMFGVSNMAEVSNYCRNPNSDPLGPWCYTAATTAIQYCSVPLCNPTSNTTTNTTSSRTINPFDTIAGSVIGGVIGMLSIASMTALAGASAFAFIPTPQVSSAKADPIISSTTYLTQAEKPSLAAERPLPNAPPYYIFKKLKTVSTYSTTDDENTYEATEANTPINPPLTPVLLPPPAAAAVTTVTKVTTTSTKKSENQSQNGNANSSAETKVTVPNLYRSSPIIETVGYETYPNSQNAGLSSYSHSHSYQPAGYNSNESSAGYVTSKSGQILSDRVQVMQQIPESYGFDNSAAAFGYEGHQGGRQGILVSQLSSVDGGNLTGYQGYSSRSGNGEMQVVRDANISSVSSASNRFANAGLRNGNYSYESYQRGDNQGGNSSDLSSLSAAQILELSALVRTGQYHAIPPPPYSAISNTRYTKRSSGGGADLSSVTRSSFDNDFQSAAIQSNMVTRSSARQNLQNDSILNEALSSYIKKNY